MNTPIRKAFVLGAGLGTRLKSLTARKPKPLVPICGKPLVTFAFDHLIRNGAKSIVINTHHCHQSYDEVFPEKKYCGATLHFEHEPTLLETGGGIKNIEPLVRGETFIVYNGDILCDLPLERAAQAHFEMRNEVTLVLRSSGGPLHIALDEKTGRVLDIANRLRSPTAPRYLFTGIYIVSPAFLFRIPSRSKISVIPIFMNMIQKAHALGGVVIDEGNWWDLGTREKYLEVHRFFAQPHHAFQTGCGSGEGERWPQWRHPTAKVAASATITGATSIGAGAIIGERAQIADCVLWENARVEPDSILRNCILTPGQTASGTHSDLDF